MIEINEKYHSTHHSATKVDEGVGACRSMRVSTLLLVNMMLSRARIAQSFLRNWSPMNFDCWITRYSALAKDADSLILEEAAEAFAQVQAHYKSHSDHPVLLNNQESTREILQHVDNILFDCDGVLYRTPNAVPTATQTLEHLKTKHRLFFVTNNAAVSRSQLNQKLQKILGIHLDDSMMMTSAYAAARYLQKQGASRVFAIGSEGLFQELRLAGFDIVNPPDNGDATMTRDELDQFDFDVLGNTDAVVVGHDTGFNFRKLCLAVNILQANPQATLLATNMDNFDIVRKDVHVPGNGALVKSIEFASQRPVVDVGKPSHSLMELLEDEYGIDPAKSLFVGDRIDTDILFAKNTGMKSLLVLTGVSKLEALIDADIIPSAIAPHVGLLNETT